MMIIRVLIGSVACSVKLAPFINSVMSNCNGALALSFHPGLGPMQRA